MQAPHDACDAKPRLDRRGAQIGVPISRADSRREGRAAGLSSSTGFPHAGAQTSSSSPSGGERQEAVCGKLGEAANGKCRLGLQVLEAARKIVVIDAHHGVTGAPKRLHRVEGVFETPVKRRSVPRIPRT